MTIKNLTLYLRCRNTSRQKFDKIPSFDNNIWVLSLSGCRYCHGTLNLTTLEMQQFIRYFKSYMSLHKQQLLRHTRFSSHEMPYSFKADFTIGQASCKYFSAMTQNLTHFSHDYNFKSKKFTQFLSSQTHKEGRGTRRRELVPLY